MRKAGVTYLPKWPKEEPDAYQARLKTSTLLPAFSETVQNMTGRVFADPITLTEDVPEPIKEMAEDFDLQGNNLQVWSQSLFSAGLSHGLCHVLADYPQAD
ncbi:DNA-binding protein, partial [Pseudomonas sp. KHB2.9]